MRASTSMALGTFADCQFYADPDFRSRQPRRDPTASIVRDHACPECNAPAGLPCIRQTVAGPVRRSPHLERGALTHSADVGRSQGSWPAALPPERRAALYREHQTIHATGNVREWAEHKARELGVGVRSIYRAVCTKPVGGSA